MHNTQNLHISKQTRVNRMKERELAIVDRQ